MQDRDYYKILKVSKNASTEDIKEAYRRLAREYHPDLHPGNPTAAERFKEICQAYEVLSDSVQRSEYDQGFEPMTSPQRKREKTPQDFYVRGVAKALNKDYQGAVEDYTQAIELNPQFVEAFLKRASTRYQLGDDRGTLKDCTQALQINPNLALAYYYQGRARYRLGYTQAALEAYSQTIRLEPDQAQAYYHRGIANHDLQELPSAVEDLKQASALFGEQGDRNGYQLAKDTLKAITKNRKLKKYRNHTLGATMAVFSNTLFAFKSLAINPVGGLLTAFSSLDKSEAIAVGILFATVTNFSFVTGIYLGWQDIFNELSIYKLMVLGAVPFFSIALISALARGVFRRRGSLAGDIFLAGASLQPLSFLFLLSSLAKILPSNTLLIISVFVSCYTILILYSGCTQISNLSEKAATLIVPGMLIVSGWFAYLVLTTIQF
ncbi:MAG: DnaJ domain-containing protein [Coleofasciculaceae cyanobacterium]